jgi:hypothetical protein
MGTLQHVEAIKIVETVRHDTVLVTGIPDTIYKDRIIYRTVGAKHDRHEQIELVRATEMPQAKEIGINMKEKQDLELLLVSGSR